MDYEEKRDLERLKGGMRSETQLQVTDKRNDALLQKAKIDAETKLTIAQATPENIKLLHEQAKENRELDFSDYQRYENTRLQVKDAELSLDRLDHEYKAEADNLRAMELENNRLKNDLLKMIAEHHLRGSGAELPKEVRDYIQAQAKRDLEE